MKGILEVKTGGVRIQHFPQTLDTFVLGVQRDEQIVDGHVTVPLIEDAPFQILDDLVLERRREEVST